MARAKTLAGYFVVLAFCCGCGVSDFGEFKEFKCEGGRFKVLMPGTPKEEKLSAAGIPLKTYRVESWDKGCAVAYADIPDTTSAKAHRLHAALYMIACSYESAISCAQLDQLEGLAKRWKAILSEIENDRSANEARRDPFYGVLRPH